MQAEGSIAFASRSDTTSLPLSSRHKIFAGRGCLSLLAGGRPCTPIRGSGSVFSNARRTSVGKWVADRRQTVQLLPEIGWRLETIHAQFLKLLFMFREDYGSATFFERLDIIPPGSRRIQLSP